MSLPKKLEKILDEAKVKYEVVPHRIVYTAFDRAATLKAKVTEVAKTLVLKSDKGPLMVILSAGHQLDLTKLTKLAKAKKIRIPSEKDIVTILSMKKGSVISFASLYGLPLYVEKQFLKNKRGIFSGGSFKESIVMLVKDFIKTEKPIIGIFGLVKKIKKPAAPKKKKPTKKKVDKKKK